ncbi:MAG TPA: hypothetical protein VLA89_15610 [Gemmatimonadales bacterium]|nr:hypothetical protein [Gemmatimonadales bacterium]
MFRRGTPLWYVREALGWVIVLAVAVPLTIAALMLFVVPYFLYFWEILRPR